MLSEKTVIRCNLCSLLAAIRFNAKSSVRALARPTAFSY